MELQGHIRNGVVVFDGDPTLPEGVAVTVTIPETAAPVVPLPVTRIVREPGKLPYVTGGVPGTIHLTNGRIYEIFEEEEIEALKRIGSVPS